MVTFLILGGIALVILVIVSWVMLSRQRAPGDPRFDRAVGPDTTADVHDGTQPPQA
jgi:hypothetical protein